MADDANFVNGRLRLTAFLRLIENELPSRPSRFRRRDPVSAEQSHLSSLEAAPPIGVPLVLKPEHGIPAVDLAISQTLPQTNHIQCNVSEELVAPHNDIARAGLPLQRNSPYDLSALPDFSERCSNRTTEDNGESRCGYLPVEQPRIVRSSMERHPSALPSDQTSQQARKAPTVKPRKTSHRRYVSRSPRKRRLPVNELPLIRTTTADGLPQPEDPIATMMKPIAILDSIEESLLPESIAIDSLSIKQPSHSNASKQKLSPHMIKKPHKSYRFSTRLVERPRKRDKNILAPRGARQYPQKSLTTVGDGFDAIELRYTPTKELVPRAKVSRSVKQKTAVINGLSLASGPLPAPLVGDTEAETAYNAVGSQSVGGCREAPSSTFVQDIACRGKLSLIHGQSLTHNEPLDSCHSERLEQAIVDQFSSITAPIRRSSDVSELEVDGEANSRSEKEHGYGDYNTTINTMRNSSSTEVITFTADESYLEHARYSLDGADMAESVDEEVWWQYNGMD